MPSTASSRALGRRAESVWDLVGTAAAEHSTCALSSRLDSWRTPVLTGKAVVDAHVPASASVVQAPALRDLSAAVPDPDDRALEHSAVHGPVLSAGHASPSVRRSRRGRDGEQDGEGRDGGSEGAHKVTAHRAANVRRAYGS